MKLPIEEFDTPILTTGGVKGPAFNQRGEVVVTEWNGNCVSIFSSSGEKLQSFGTYGSGLGQLFDPCGVAVDGEGNFSRSFGKKGSGRGQFNLARDIACDRTGKVYVSDRDNHRIQVFTADGST